MPQPAARLREAVAPAWLIEAVRPRQAPVPWALMIRAALAIGVPLTAGFVTGRIALGLLPAMGGLSASVVDIGGPYPARIRRVGCATGLGGTAGLLIGSLIHGQGWVAVLVLVLVAGVSALISAAGSTASVTGLPDQRAERRLRPVAVRPGGRQRAGPAADAAGGAAHREPHAGRGGHDGRARREPATG